MAILYFTQVTLLKMSLLFFYLQIFPALVVKRLLWGTISFNAVFGLTFVLLAIFQCRPISYFWDKWDGEHSGPASASMALRGPTRSSVSSWIWMLAIPMWQLRSSS